MNPFKRQLVLGAVMLAGPAAAAWWAYDQARQARQSAQAAREDLEQCRALAGEIEHLRHKPNLAGAEEFQLAILARLDEWAARVSQETRHVLGHWPSAPAVGYTAGPRGSGTRMVQLGTVAPIGFDEFEPGPWLACYRQLGCRVVQAYRNHGRGVTLQQIRDALAAGEMPCDSLHGVFGEEFDPSNPDEAGRRFAVDTFGREGELCRQLGGSLVVVHCSTIRHQGVPPAQRARRVDQLKRSIEQLGQAGRQIDVVYAFENLPAYHVIGSDVAELAGILRQVAAPATGLCFDTGHAHMVGGCAAAVAAASDRIVYVHASDNSGQADEHEMLTRGTLDVPGVARALHGVGYDGTIMLEVFRSVAQLQAMIQAGLAQRLADMLRLASGE